MHEEEKYFVLGQLEQPRQNKNLLYWHDKPTNQPRKGPFHLSSLSPHSPQFQQSAGPPLSSLSASDPPPPTPSEPASKRKEDQKKYGKALKKLA
jgi:hypothetical protein